MDYKKVLMVCILLLFLFAMQFTVFAEEENDKNCENGVCTLSDHQNDDRDNVTNDSKE
jgi:hypothetical protein